MPEFDYNAIAAEFDAAWEEAPQLQEEMTDEIETTEEITEDEEVETETDDEQLEEENTEVPTEDEKRNKAFAELRRQAEDNKKAADFLQRLASQSGMSPEEVLQRFESRVLEDEAKQNNVPVEVMERLKNLEQENSLFKEQTVAQKMDRQIQDVITKYNATEDDIRSTFEEMFQSGVDPRINPNVDFEKFYKAANFDKILESKVNESKQKSLEQKKQRQQQAAIPSGTGVTQTGNSDTAELAKKDALDILANW